MNLSDSLGQQGSFPFTLYLVILWSIFWKGVALWRSAKLKQKYWFVVILIIGDLTLGLLEIIYLFRFAKKRLTLSEFKGWFLRDDKKS